MTPYRCGCGHLVINTGGVLEDADSNGGLGTEHECNHSEDVEGSESIPCPYASVCANCDCDAGIFGEAAIHPSRRQVS